MSDPDFKILIRIQLILAGLDQILIKVISMDRAPNFEWLSTGSTFCTFQQKICLLAIVYVIFGKTIGKNHIKLQYLDQDLHFKFEGLPANVHQFWKYI